MDVEQRYDIVLFVIDLDDALNVCYFILIVDWYNFIISSLSFDME